MLNKTLILCLSVAMSLSASALTLEEFQQTLDLAYPGDVVTLPAGTYQGELTIPDGVMVVGDGVEDTIIDGNGAEIVVHGGKETALIGVTVRNGKTGIHTHGKYMGVFECFIENVDRTGIWVDNGTAIIQNNIIRGKDQRTTGIFCLAANPYIAGNMIYDHAVGVRIVHNYIPTLHRNVFRNNRIGIEVSHGAKVVTRGNVFDGNGEPIKGAGLHESDAVRPYDPVADLIARSISPAAYRAQMDMMFDELVAMHPLVVYDLQPVPGQFDVICLFPWATFAVSASAIETSILQYDAYDWVTDESLHAVFQLGPDERPGVVANNPEKTEKNLDRYVLENRYVHEPSYRYNEAGNLVFRRETNLSRIEVVLPKGYKALHANYPYDSRDAGGRQVLMINDVGFTTVEVEMIRTEM